MFSYRKILGFVVCLSLLLSLSNVVAAAASFNFLASLPAGQQQYALEGQTALVQGNDGLVRVYILNGNSWQEQAVLQPTRSNPLWDTIARDMAIQGDTVLVRASGYCGVDEQSSSPGAVFVFKRSGNTWTQQQEINVECGGASRVDLDGSRFVVNDRGTTVAPETRVLVYQYNGSQWVQETILYPDYAGCACPHGGNREIALDGDFVLATGAIFGDFRTAVFSFTGSGWSEFGGLGYTQFPIPYGIDLDGPYALIAKDLYTLYGPFVNNPERFDDMRPGPDSRYAVAVEGNTAVISGTGTFIFTVTNNVWTQQQEITHNGAQIFGKSVALSGNLLQVNELTFIRDNVPPQEEMLANPDFESDFNQDMVPDFWTRKNTTADSLVCNEEVALVGNCAYRFKGETGANRSLIQNVGGFSPDGFGLKAGDHIKLTGFYNKQSTGTVHVWLYVSYADLPKDQARVKFTKTTNGYVPLKPISMTLKAPPTRIRIRFANETTSGDTYVDNLSLSLTRAGNNTVIPFSPDNLIPLP